MNAGRAAVGALTRCLLVVALLCGFAPRASAAEPIRIAFIDGISGPFANVGEGSWRHLVLAMEAINRHGGVLGGRRLVAAEFDSKSNPQEGLLALRAAMDQGYRIVFQGNGSNVALALSDAITKHAQRNPQDPVLFLDYAAADPALTNERCSFWHFRFEADVPMKMRALVDAIANSAEIRSVYLINQDYSFGQAVSRYAKEMLRQRRPDIQIVGDDRHPLGQVKDFAPYAAKIKAAGADAVITGNWGNDLNLLMKAAREMDLDATFYTYYGTSDGAATVIGKAGLDRMKVVSVWHPNIGGSRTDDLVHEWRTRFPDSPTELDYASFRIAMEMLAAALDQAGSFDLRKVALAMEGMHIEDDAGEVWMRADNHQLIQPMFVSTFVVADGREVRYDIEHTGFGLRTDRRVEGAATVLPTTCKMERP